MHVCLFISSLAGGGAERVVCTLASAWAERSDGIRVTIVTGDADTEPGYPLSSSVSHVRLDLKSSSVGIWSALRATKRRVCALREVIAKLKPDCAVAFMDEMAVLVSLASVGSGVPVVAALRSDPRGPHLNGTWRRLRVPFYQHVCDAVVVQSASARRLAERLFPGAPLHVITNPLPQLPVPPPMERRARRVVSVGRLVNTKAMDVLVKAFSRSCGPAEGWELLIYGTGPERERLQLQIDALGLGLKVRLMGTTDRVFDCLAEASVFVLTSRTEGFPNCLLEAAAMGCACVSTDCDFGPRDILGDNLRGLLVPTDNVSALTETLDDLIGDLALRVRFSQGGIELRNKFRVEQISRDLAAAFFYLHTCETVFN